MVGSGDPADLPQCEVDQHHSEGYEDAGLDALEQPEAAAGVVQLPVVGAGSEAELAAADGRGARRRQGGWQIGAYDAAAGHDEPAIGLTDAVGGHPVTELPVGYEVRLQREGPGSCRQV